MLSLQGDFDTAIPALRRALTLRPVYVEASFNLGLALAAKGQFAESATQFRRVLELRPEHTQARDWLNRVLKSAAADRPQ